MIDHCLGEPFSDEMVSAMSCARACSARRAGGRCTSARSTRRHVRPRAVVERLAGGGDGPVDVRGRGVGHLADHLLGRAARSTSMVPELVGRDPLAADVELLVDLHGVASSSRLRRRDATAPTSGADRRRRCPRPENLGGRGAPPRSHLTPSSGAWEDDGHARRARRGPRSSTCRGASRVRSACCCSPSRAPTSIKVEPPGGDPFRGYNGYTVWNRSAAARCTVDLKSAGGREAFRRLRRDADVLVETFRPGVMDRLGVGYDALHAINPRLVYCSCPAYPRATASRSGPATTRSVQASSGQQWEQPGWRPGPIFLAHADAEHGRDVPRADRHPRRARSPRGRPAAGQHVRTSLFQGALLYTTQIWQHVERGDAAFYGLMAKTYPPGRAPGDDLRVRGPRVRPRRRS